MKASTTRTSTSEAAVLLKAVEGVFRKLIRLLVGRISLKKLQQLIQIIFIEESEAKLKKETPHKSPTLTDTALLTGVDIRTIKKTREQIASGIPIHQEPVFLNNFMPMFKVLDVWMSSEEFFDVRAGKPKKLKIQGVGATFSGLVSQSLSSRGLSASQVLNRLKDFGAVSINESNEIVELIQQDNIFISREFSDSLDIGFSAIENLVDTVSHNLQHLSDNEDSFFQRGCWNYQFNPETLDEDRKTIKKHLARTDKKSRELLTSLANPIRQSDQVTVGIGMFYFEKNVAED